MNHHPPEPPTEHSASGAQLPPAKKSSVLAQGCFFAIEVLGGFFAFVIAGLFFLAATRGFFAAYVVMALGVAIWLATKPKLRGFSAGILLGLGLILLLITICGAGGRIAP